ncbi:MAG: glutamyl-tRNA reductase [Nitrospirae bacterium]|nr:glutamyl-tRNA reductase [Nitrospirota bacterium]
MNILVVGLNHDTAGVEIREKVAFDGTKLGNAVNTLKGFPEIKENIILSTCNRVEIYANTDNTESAGKRIIDFLSGFHNIAKETLEQSLYIHNGRNAVRHIFRVGGSLDSMIVGEPQILGQLKDAFDFAHKVKSTGIFLNHLMKDAFSVAKRIRNETKIAEGAVSISFAAVELARKIFEDLSMESFMLIGAGEMAELAAKHLIQNGVKDVLVTNRTFQRAEELATEFNGKAVEFDKFLDALIHTDIVICSTGAPHYILHKTDMQKIMKQRKNKPMFIIDISVPRNVEPEINDLDNIYLYDVDDLQGVIKTNIEERRKEQERAERIVDEEVEAFLRWQDTLSAVPTIVALREKAESIRKEELEKFFRKHHTMKEEEIRAIEAMTNVIINKLIHSPTVALKGETENKEEMVALIRRLYGINEEK